MKVHFKNTHFFRLLYDDPHIAFFVVLDDISNAESIVLYSNYHQENFIEMRFDKTSRRLYDIEMVCIDPSSVTVANGTNTDVVGNDIYDCLWVENDTGDNIDVKTDFPTKIFRFDDSIKIVWSTDQLKYFRITDKCSVGIDNNNNIRGVLLTSLSSDIIQQIIR